MLKLRQRKRLINSAALCCAMTMSWIVYQILVVGPSKVEQILNLPTQANTTAKPQITQHQRMVNPQQTEWQRKLRQPLYDPPPAPKVVVKKTPRPVTIKLTGTVIEPKNSQAFLRLANGSVALRRVGDQVTGDPRDGQITEITATEIVIQREEDEVRLQVNGPN